MPVRSQTPAVESWTPTLTFNTPGDFAATYSNQTGKYIKEGNKVTLWFIVSTSSFTYTTATGTLKISGLPFTASNSAANLRQVGSVEYQGINKASYTQLTPTIDANTSLIYFAASGMGQALSTVVSTDVPTGSSLNLRGCITYFID